MPDSSRPDFLDTQDEIEMSSTADRMRKRPRRGIYILPNLFTSASLFSGFYSMIAAIQANYDAAAWAILISGVFDGLDGRVARMTGTTSKFGVEYDSLADMVAFGVAPGILAFLWGLQGFGRLGWLAGFLFVATTALRLARFNTLSESRLADKKYFMGLPCPSAAIMLATTVLLVHHIGITGQVRHYGVLLMVYALSFLMVSNVRYYSFKEVRWIQQHPFSSMVGLILAMVVVAIEPSVTLFMLFMVYVLSGPLLITVQTLKARRSGAAHKEHVRGGGK